MTGRLAALAVMALLAACTPATDDAASPAATGGIVNVGLSRIADAGPIRREAAAIEIAFDPANADRMATSLPPIDYATQALLCLSLGERSTGGWSVTMQSISLDGHAMSIRAREVRPRPGSPVTQGFTYPTDCAVIDRTVLPAGTLTVRADDTISDEFIVDAVIEVPAA